MSGLFRPLSIEQLAYWLFSELDGQASAFGIPRQLFFEPDTNAPYRSVVFGQSIDTPFGPAAGPHTQLAQNIIAAWLCGARYIELKTVQTLDDIDVSKPCIDMQDEGYNVEWSQELRVFESFDEYLRAWVLIHALHHKLGFPGESPAVVFNLSVGYDLAGIHRPNMQWFLDQVADVSGHVTNIVEAVAEHYPAVRDIEIPARMSNNVTLSTMHGCPPAEIESICAYLLEDRGLHTMVKCNPTLLGPDAVRRLLHDDLGYLDVTVPDGAFAHDMKYGDAVPMLERLLETAAGCEREFGVKLSNTLEVENVRPTFDPEETTAYLSGRALHAITVNLAERLASDFDGALPMSFSAGASCFNAPDLLAAGMQTVTVCSDLLKTGGYLRLLDYIDAVDEACASVAASTLDEYITRASTVRDGSAAASALDNLQRYAVRTRTDPDYRKSSVDTSHTKTERPLTHFDCIRAPCVDECPLGQQVPAYLDAVRAGDYEAARDIIRVDNPIACVLGRACDHRCELACVRTHLDEPVAIRDIKRFAMEHGDTAISRPAPTVNPRRVAIIGAGPGGMAAASELAQAGLRVEIFEQHPYAGGMVGGAVPEYRVPRAILDRDLARLDELGVEIHYGKRVGTDLRLSDLRGAGFDDIVIMVGAQLGRSLPLGGEDCGDVIDALDFLRLAREDSAPGLGRRIGIVGGGDTAMDCARIAWRQGSGDVMVIYRRSKDQMPAEREEIEQLLDEGITIVEMASPEALVVEDGRLRALACSRTRYAGDRDASGRKIAHKVPDSSFEIPLDSLVVAISQQALLDFFGDTPIAVNDGGYIRVDPETFETSIANLYAGGDVVNDGPASIVKAAAAGKAIANRILDRQRVTRCGATAPVTDVAGLLRRRSHRTRRNPAPQRPVAERRNDREVVLTYSAEAARSEAARCLDCDSYCSICVGVCPNLALFTYESIAPDPAGDAAPRAAAQRYQVAVLADLCNECGNCTTFCPASGRPFHDKPRLFCDRGDFEREKENAFFVKRSGGSWTIEVRWENETYRTDSGGDVHGPRGGEPLPTSVRDTMTTLLRTLPESSPMLPAFAPTTSAGSGRLAHPGYGD